MPCTPPGHSVDVAADLEGGDFLLSKTTYDLVVLAQSLPEGDAMEFVRQQAGTRWSIPVLVLITSGLDRDRTTALQYAGDYLDVPFRPAELLARLDSLARRRPTRESPALPIDEPPVSRVGEPLVRRVGELEIDRERGEVRRRGKSVRLTAAEFAVLEVLADRLGQLVTLTELLDYAAGAMSVPTSNVVDTTTKMLRQKLGAPELVQRVGGLRLPAAGKPCLAGG